MPGVRYERQLPLIGADGQARLLASRVAIIGQGALGTASASYLARAGVGSLLLVDDDRVELSNLQRQSLFDEYDVGESKAVTARDRLRRINSDIEVEACTGRLDADNADAILSGADLVVDGTDNLAARELINRWCVEHRVPWIYGGVAGGRGMTMNILPGGSCFKCLVPGGETEGDNARTSGIFSTTAALIAAIQCTEAVKILARGVNDASVRRTLLYVDLAENNFEQHAVTRLPGCSVCGGYHGN